MISLEYQLKCRNQQIAQVQRGSYVDTLTQELTVMMTKKTMECYTAGLGLVWFSLIDLFQMTRSIHNDTGRSSESHTVPPKCFEYVGELVVESRRVYSRSFARKKKYLTATTPSTNNKKRMTRPQQMESRMKLFNGTFAFMRLHRHR